MGMGLPGMGPLTLGLSKRSQARLAGPRRWLWRIEVCYKLRWGVWRLRGFPAWRALQSCPASAITYCAEPKISPHESLLMLASRIASDADKV